MEAENLDILRTWNACTYIMPKFIEFCTQICFQVKLENVDSLKIYGRASEWEKKPSK